MLQAIIVFILSFVWGVTLIAQTAPPVRKVLDNVVTSERDPAVRIELPKAAQYVGADRWVLYGIADCELHAFVEADAQKNVQRLYWIQFEGYLPSRPDLRHTYDSPKHTTIGGMDFYVDTWVRAKGATTESGSDREHIEALVRARGYRMPEAMMYVRLVHLLDEEKRKEFMIIYGEDLAATGLTADELSEGGKAHDRWPGIADAMIGHAKRRIIIESAKP
ncbi:MAG: hypothetical protein WBQ85_02350 [Candidatus Sulfotelmatobacter sp.]